MKACVKCGETKPLSEFYRHSKTSHYFKNECKACCRRALTERRNADPHWNEKRRAYAARRVKTAEWRAKHVEEARKSRALNPLKTKARDATSNAIKAGKLVRLPCETCGDSKSQAHHHDYSKPLDVTWLCFKHHRELAHGQKVGLPQ